MAFGFQFNKIIIIQSLDDTESRTGELLYSFIYDKLEKNYDGIGLELVNIEYAAEFQMFMEKLAAETKKGLCPIIHIECHGDEHKGLEFKNGSELSWEELSSELLNLNVATDFNLFLTISACYGLYFISQLNPLKPAPTWGVVGPSDTVYPDELLAGFKMFYKCFLETLDFDYASESLSKHKLSKGYWHCQNAESWFIQVAINYVTRYCTKLESRKRVAYLHSENLRLGQKESMSSIKKEVIKLNRQKLTKDYFETYFSIAKIPNNRLRFLSLKDSLESHLNQMKKSGLYII